MEKKWINESGVCEDIAIKENIERFFESGVYLIGFTDCYKSGYFKRDVLDFDFANALEVRVFDDKKEIIFSRSMVGDQLKWRVTDDSSLVDGEDYFDCFQYIDRNEKKVSYDENTKMLSLFTTVGGKYELPIQKDISKVIIRKYISYDKNKMAHVEDQRIVGFVKD